MQFRRMLPLLLAALFLCGGCGIKNSIVKRPMDSPVIQVSELNSRISNARLKQIIISACSRYGWKVDSSTDSSVTATLNHNAKESVTIEIPFSPQKVEFIYRSSQNMRYDGTKIHRSYNRWLKNLEVDIRNGIAAG